MIADIMVIGASIASLFVLGLTVRFAVTTAS